MIAARHPGGRPPKVPIVCSECGHTELHAARGLCWRCYGWLRRNPDWIFDRDGLYSRGQEPSGPARRAVAARPGSPEKVAALVARAESGEELWHAEDWPFGQQSEEFLSGEAHERRDDCGRGIPGQ